MGVWLNNGGSVTPHRAPVAKAELPVDVPEVKAMLVEYLRRLLADTVTVYLRAQGFHWNVAGPDFAQYHDLYGSIYEDLYESLDPIAESIRKLDAVAPFMLGELLAVREIQDGRLLTMLPAALNQSLLAGIDTLSVCLLECFDLATAANEQGLAAFLSDRQDVVAKWAWQLRASLS
jgi:starvation-inducible DNA-binding protein